MSSGRPKKIIVTSEEVANTPTRKATRGKSTPAQADQDQVLELPTGGANESGVTLIQVNELGEVATIDGSILGQDITIQIGDDPPTSATILEAAEDDDGGGEDINEDDTEFGYRTIQYQSPENYRREMLETFHWNLTRKGDRYADLAIFCSDGIAWSSKLLLSAASKFIRDLLLDVPGVDDTCLVLPHLTKAEFMTFQETLFARENSEPTDMFSVIKGCEMLGIDLVSVR
jgi:hypothetical protein